MTEIKVILEDALDAASTHTEEETKLAFEKLAEEEPTIPQQMFDGFLEMWLVAQREHHLIQRPELKELLLRRVVQMATPSVIPQIRGIPRHAPTGLATRGTESVPDTALRISFDGRVPTVVVTDSERLQRDSEHSQDEYLAVPREELDVVGVIVNAPCVATMTDMWSRIVIGGVGYAEIAESCNTLVGDIWPRSLQTTPIAFDTADSTQKLISLFDYYRISFQYMRGLATAVFVYAKLRRIATAPSVGDVTPSAIQWIWAQQATIPQIDGIASTQRDILVLFEQVHKGRFANRPDADLADLALRGFGGAYNRAILRGRDDATFRAWLDLYAARRRAVDFRAATQDKFYAELDKLNSYRGIIGKKFGMERRAEIDAAIAANPAIALSADAVLDTLRPAERKPVALEYAAEQKYLEARASNNCPHVKIYAQVRAARDASAQQRSFGALREFFARAPLPDKMIACNNCKFDIICPHVRDFIELDIAGTNQSEIKAKLTKYIDRSYSSASQYFCKICGELISSLEAFEDTERTQPDNMDEDLKNFLWGELIGLVRYLHFTQLVDVAKLVSAMRDATYPWIFEIEKQILKSKTNTTSEIKAKKRLFTAIYGFAYLIQLVASGKVEFKNMSKTSRPPRAATPLVVAIKYALDAIIVSRNVVIREIPGMNPDLIRNKLVEAYKAMSGAASSKSLGALVTYSAEKESIITTLSFDPVYRYLTNINQLDEALGGGRAVPADPAHLLGSSPQTLEKSDNIFAKMHIPKFDSRWNRASFAALKPFSTARAGSSLIANVEAAWGGYLAASFIDFASNITSKLYAEPMYVNITPARGSQSAAPLDVKLRQPYEVARETFAELAAREAILLKMRDAIFCKGFCGTGDTKRWGAPPRIDSYFAFFAPMYAGPVGAMGRVYDEQGRRHIWDMYLLNKDNATTSEIKVTMIAKELESGKRFEGRIIDKKCSVCGALWSQSGSLDAARIHEALDAINNVTNFFRFYENRCPVGGPSGLHEWTGVDKSRCGRCEIVTAFLRSPLQKESLDFYNKYKQNYSADRAAAEPAVGENKSIIAASQLQLSKDTKADLDKWSHNFNIVLDLANKLKINHRLISALGAVERQEYHDIESGIYTPNEPEARDDFRIYLLDTHIKNLITEYNRLRYFYRLAHPNSELSLLIDASGISKHKLASLPAALPDICGDYNLRYDYVVRTKKPREAVAYCIQTFCEMCLHIWGDEKVDETGKLRHDFVQWIVKKILRAEELMSKPGHFNWSLLFGEKGRGSEVFDTNYNKETAEGATPGEETAAEAPEDYGSTDAPFSTDAFDVETDAADDDDPSNQVRVGEDIGLD